MNAQTNQVAASSTNHILKTDVKGRIVTFYVDDVDATIKDFALAFELKGKNIPAKVAHRLGDQIKQQTGAQRIKVLFSTFREKVTVAIPKFTKGVNGQLQVLPEQGS
jgi:hypothetical protein